MPNLSMQAMNRLRFSIKNDVNNNSVHVLQHQIQKFTEQTGLEPRGVWGVAPPEGMTPEQADIYNNILQRFVDNSRSASDIKEEYRTLPDREKGKKSTKEMEEALAKADRIRNDDRLRENLYSNIIQELFTLAKDNAWDTNDVYNAMVETLDQLDAGEVANTQDDYIDSVIDKMRGGYY